MGALAMDSFASSRMKLVAAVAVIVVCGLFAVMVAEANHTNFQSGEIVQEEVTPPGSPKAHNEMSDTSIWRQRTFTSKDTEQAGAALDSTKKAAKEEKLKRLEDQQKDAVKKQHKLNQAARGAMRKAASTSAKATLGKTLNVMASHVKKMTARAAKLTAQIISKGTTFSKADRAAENKMKLLEKDTVLLVAARAKALHEAALAKQSYAKQAAQYKVLVKAKVLRAEGDLKTIRRKLSRYQVAKSTEKMTADEMHKASQKVVKLRENLKSKHDRVVRLTQQHINALKRAKTQADKTRKALKVLTKQCKKKLKKMRSMLKRLTNSPDIAPHMAAKIANAHKNIAQQVKMLQRQDSIHRKLQRSLHRAMKNTKVLRKAAKKREQMLVLANKAYRNLKAAVRRLRAAAAEQSKGVVIKAPRGSLTASARKVKDAIAKAVQSVAKKKRKQLQKSIMKAAQVAASDAANKMDTKQMTKQSQAEVSPFSETDQSQDYSAALETMSPQQVRPLSIDEAADRLLHHDH